MPTEIAGQLDELHCGTVYLTVPVVDEMIQVGSSDPLPTATIEVRKTTQTITVRRTDGLALQAQIIEQDGDGSASPTDVFAEPVPALGIRRVSQRDGTQLWVVTLGTTCRRYANLLQLIKTIVSFSMAKQRTIGCPTPLPASA